VNIIELHLKMLDDAFSHNGWHGASLMPTLRGLSLQQLTFNETCEGYTAWGVALHCAYWKYRARRRLFDRCFGEEGVSRFARGPADWPDLPVEKTAETWQADFDLLKTEHELLKQTVARLSPGQLTAIDEKSGKPHAVQVYGVAAHDAYHTAQIRNMGVPGL
jgi:hypothetical protein